MTRAVIAAALVALALFAGCGGGDAGEATTAPPAPELTAQQREAVSEFWLAAGMICTTPDLTVEPAEWSDTAITVLQLAPDAQLGDGSTVEATMREARDSLAPCRGVLADEVAAALP
jgi:hypothetical protein